MLAYSQDIEVCHVPQARFFIRGCRYAHHVWISTGICHLIVCLLLELFCGRFGLGSVVEHESSLLLLGDGENAGGGGGRCWSQALGTRAHAESISEGGHIGFCSAVHTVWREGVDGDRSPASTVWCCPELDQAWTTASGLRRRDR